MANTKRRSKTPLDQAWPQFKRDLLQILKNRTPKSYTLVRDDNSQKFTRIIFNYNVVTKEDIYKIIAKISVNSYTNRNLRKLCQKLAESSNIGANENIKISTDTIYRKVYKNKKFLKQMNNGNIPTKPQQRHQSAQSNAGAGGRINQDW